MMKMTLDELKAHALRTGAEVVVDGQHFNTARHQVDAKPPAKAVARTAAAPMPLPTVESFSRAEVTALLQAQEERFTRQLGLVTALVQRPPEADDEDDAPVPIGFTPQYNDDGMITRVDVQYQRLQ